MTVRETSGSEAGAGLAHFSEGTRPTPGVSIVIPTWNGWRLLQRHLPSVLGAAKAYRRQIGGPTETIVVDDGSRDETVVSLAEHFPEVRVVARDRNGGFARACNSGFEVCRYPLVALLNNDVEVDEDYLKHQAGNFRHPDVFAVTARVFELDPPLFATGGKVGIFRRGFWSVYFNYDLKEGVAESGAWPLLSMYAVGGFSMFDLRKLRRLGGFNVLLSPFHWEDVDLSYRAWKRGWRVLYEPRSIGYHQISATINAHYDKAEVEQPAVRNRLLFHWINLHSRGFWWRHCFMLAILLLTRVWVADFGFYRSFWGAIRQLGQVLRLRRAERRHSRRSDREVAQLLKSFYQKAPIEIFRDRAEVEKSGRKPSSQTRPSEP